MKKRILSAILVSVMVLSVFTTGAAAAISPEPVPSEDEAPAAVGTISDQDDAEQPADVETAEPDAKDDADLAPTAEGEIPQVTGVKPSANGATIYFDPFEGAAKHFVFTKKDDGSWKIIGSTTGNSFDHKNPVNNTTYVYTVRAADENNAFISGFDKEGFSYLYLAAPKLKAVANVVGGQRFFWEAQEGAVMYTVYIKYPTGWKAVYRTAATSYFNTNVTSGKQYTYTVRCWNPETSSLQSYFDRKGIAGVYVAVPKISGFAPADGGNTVIWDASAGASRYAVFTKNAGKWKTIGVTDKTSFTHKKLTGGVLYTYTVRCIDKNGAFCSGYDTAGSSYRYLAPPQLTYVSNGVLKWSGNGYAAGFRVYRKQFGKSWEAIGTTAGTTFTDTTAQKNTLYTYTVRSVDERGKVNSYFIDSQKYYINGALANSSYSVGGKTYRFKNGELIRQGFVTIDGKMYYYNAQGVLQKNGLVGSSKEGWRYADKYGVIHLNYTGLATNSAGTWYLYKGKLDRTLRNGVTIGGVDYNILNGKAYKVTTEKDRTLFRALKIAYKVTKPSMTKSQKLKAVWNHLVTAYGECNPRADYFGTDWPELYANDIFVDGTGSCFSYAAAYAYLAKAVGCSNCYACNSGGHGWAEVEGLVYDPEWSMHSNNYSYFAMSYDDPCDVPYKAALSIGNAWGHVKI